MYKLTKVSLINWYLVSAEDVEIRDATALIGPTGAGKSSIQDAIQTVVCGGNRRYIRPNASTDNKRSDRRIIDYCLGYTHPKSDGGEPIRQNCETVLALTFSEEREDGTRHDIAVGLAYEARGESGELKLLNRFIAPGYAFSVSHCLGEDEKGAFIEAWEDIEETLKRRCPEVRFYRSNSAEKFVADLLAEMRQHGRQPDARHFLQVFSNAVAFEPIKDPTKFVRQWILTPDPLEIERVRASIARWKEMNETVERIERRLKQITATQGRYQSWSHLLVDRCYKQWRLACAQTQLQKLRLKTVSGEHKALLEQKAVVEKQLNARRNRLKDDQDYLNDLQNQLREKGVQAKLDSADKDRSHALERLQRLEEKVRDLKQLFQAAGNAKATLEWLPPEGERSLALASTALSLMEEATGANWLRHHKPEISNYLAEVQAFFRELPAHLAGGLDEKRSEVYALRMDRDAIAKNLDRADKGQVPLSQGPSRLMELLAQEGIEATPLCEVVEITDSRWQLAVEALLGRGREALIVDPQHQRRALDILHHNRNQPGMGACVIVKTTQTDSVDLSRSRPESLARVVRSDNRHALAFIETRIGGFERVETVEELERSRRAIMPDGKTTSGLSLSVQQNINLIIGQKARVESVRALQDRKSDLERRIRDLSAAIKRLEDLDRLSTRIAEASFDLDDMEDAFLSIQRDIAEADKRRQAALAEEDAELVQEVESLQHGIKEMETEIEELNDQKTGIIRKEGATGERLTTLRKDLKNAVKAQRLAIRSRTEEDLLKCLEIEGKEARGKVFAPHPFMGHRLAAEVGRADSEGQQRFYMAEMKTLEEELSSINKRIGPAAQSASQSMNDYLRDHGLDRPFTSGLHMTSEEYGWVVTERSQLEQNELRQYQEEAREAERTMRSTLTEDLLVNLHGKFQRLDHQLRSLNNQLSRHRFNNRFHSFRKKADPGYEDLRKLANKVGENPDLAEAIIEGRTDDPWLAEALRKLNELLEDTGGEGLEDYRNYFTFDLYMRLEASDDGGEIEIREEEVRDKKLMSLSGRASVGSGGEGQTPFYIAIAASMALAYYPGGNRGKEASGMGLVLFDEAFNRLDIQTTQTLIRFFEELGLQLVVAAPEVHRATFSEVMETIVVINKDEIGKRVYIDSEFPKEHARQELSKINPDWIGIEGYRKRLAEEAHAAE